MSNVDSNSSLKEIAKQVRAEIKALKKAGQLDKDLKVSVRTSYFSQGCRLDVMVTACSFQIFDTNWVLWMEANPHGSMMDNPHPKYSDNARSVVEALDAIVAPFNWEDRDPQTDYYNCNFFFHGADFHWDLEKSDKATIKEASKAEAEAVVEAEAVAEVEAVVVSAALARSGDLVPRFAVFSIAPIPLIVHLGFLFSDRVETDLFQFHRERGEWAWPDERTAISEQQPAVSGLPGDEVGGKGGVVVRVSLSEVVRADDSRALVSDPLAEIDVAIDDPDKRWLQAPQQLDQLRGLFLDVLKSIRRRVPGCSRLHVFYAGPAAGAFLLGQCINPRMDPELAVYEFSRQRDPRYRLAGVLTEEDAL